MPWWASLPIVIADDDDDRNRRHPKRSERRKKGARSRDEVAAERQAIWERTQAEIDAIVDHFHEMMPQGLARAIGAIYARYSTQLQDSIADQVRSLFEAAVSKGIFVPREHVYVDLAVRGYRDSRPGLDALRKTLAARSVQVLLVFTTNRLFRKQYKALKFIEEEIVERGLRCVFVKNGLDTADGDRWRLPFQIYAAIDEAGSGMYAANIRASHEGLLGKRRVYGTIPLGYTGEPIPGEFTKRQRPSCLIVVDQETAKWVRQIFDWYVADMLSILEIARRLNDDPDAPAPPRSPIGFWTYETVSRLFENARYRGLWEYGKTMLHYVSGKDYVRQLPREKALQAEVFEELRIVSDEVWYAAQTRRINEPSNRGRKPKDGNRKSRPKLLNGLYFCPDHNQPLYVGGANGNGMVCKICRVTPAKDRPLVSGLNRVLALETTCKRLAEFIRGDDQLIGQVIEACQQEAGAAQRPDPERLRQLKAQAVKVSKTIAFNRRNPGVTMEDQDAVAALIRQLGTEHAEVMSKVALAEAAQHREITVPTEQTVKALLDGLGDLLVAAAQSSSEEEQGRAREVIRLLTGGRIDLYQCGERKAQRGWLEGRFKLRLLDYALQNLVGSPMIDGREATEVTISYRKPRPSAEVAERAFELYSEGRLNAEIAGRLGCSRSRLTKLLHDAHEARGLPMPDGRSRRSQLVEQHLTPPYYQQIADRAKELWDTRKLMREIAEEIGCDHNTITSAIKFWHQSRGLPVPDSRNRRKQLPGTLSDSQLEAGTDADDQLGAA